MQSGRRKRGNIDQLLRDDLRYIQKSAKTTPSQIEKALKTNGVTGHKIVFVESPTPLKASELIDFSGITLLDAMDAFVGATSGVLKSLSFKKSSFTNFRATKQLDEASGSEQQEREEKQANSITEMCFTGTDHMEVLVGRRGGRVDLFNVLTEQFNSLFCVPQNGHIKGLQAIESDRILTAVETGEVGVWTGTGQRLSNEQWTAGNNLLAMRLCPGAKPSVFATGGQENPLKVWDLAEEKCIFTAKNVRPDALELRVPVHVTNCRFLDETGKCIVTSTANSQIRVYDTRTQRRPTLEWTFLGEPVKALSTCCRDWHVVAGNTTGELGLIDMRSATKNSRLVKKYRGFSGSIRCIDASPSDSKVLSCGIDRFAILHDLDTGAALKKIYCKVQVNRCLLCRDSLVGSAGKRIKDQSEE